MQSISKNKIKWIRSLQQKKFRDDLGLFVVEGEKMVNEALESNEYEVVFLCLTKSSIIISKNSNCEVVLVTEEELKSISS